MLMPTPASLLRASSDAPINLRPQLSFRLRLAGGFVPYVQPVVVVTNPLESR
jgi:hypothetical protein